MLLDISKSQENFDLTLKSDNNLVRSASNLSLTDFILTSPNTANRMVNGAIKYLVGVNPHYCTCTYYVEYAICKHFIALCKFVNFELFKYN